MVEMVRIEGVFGHQASASLHGTKVVVRVKALREHEEDRHEYFGDTDGDDSAVELTALVASDLVRPTMTRFFFRAGGGAFEPEWWIPTVQPEARTSKLRPTRGYRRRAAHLPGGTSLALFPGKQGDAGTSTPFTIQ
jgi:hypothetical protein